MSDSYAAVEKVQVSVEFGALVTAVGDPWIAIYADPDTGPAGSWRADYSASPSSGNTLVGEYTVQAGDSALSGIWKVGLYCFEEGLAGLGKSGDRSVASVVAPEGNGSGALRAG